MDPAKPSLQLLRSLTDEHVLRTLMRQRRMTRAELAAETGISKPAVGESVRRLAEAGLVADTGQRTAGGRGRGRVGSYYALAGDVGVALAVSIAPEGIVAECVDAYGGTVSRAERSISRPARPGQVAAALQTVAGQAHRGAGQTPRLAVVSAAGPVDRGTGRLVQLPDEPFLLGALDPAAVLAGHVAGPVVVDNDVNWAALAERDGTSTAALDDFGYVFLGQGLGSAIISAGQVIRGRACGGWRGRPPHHGRPGRPGDAPHRGVRRTGAAAGRFHRDRRRPPAQRGHRRGTAGGGHPPGRGPGRRRSAGRDRGARRPGTHHHRRLMGQPPRYPHGHRSGGRPTAPVRSGASRPGDG